MRHDLPRLAGRVFNTPLLFHRHQLDTVLGVIGARIIDGLDIEARDMPAPEPRQRSAFALGGEVGFAGGGYMVQGGIAVLPVLGTLVRRGTWMDSYCGMTSYSALTDAATEIMTSAAVRGLMLEMDTPGGEAGGVFDLADFIRHLSESTGKPVWAHANELAASAGYAIASAAEEIWIARTGEVGSIGVVAAHVDVSKADEKAGVRWTYIHAGEHKVDGNMHEALGDDVRGRIQDDVDVLYDMFVQQVSQNRGIDAGKVRDTKADTFRGTKAVDAGLADEVGTLDEALAAFADYVDELQIDDAPASMSAARIGLMRTTGRNANRNRPAPVAAAAKENEKPDAVEDDANKPGAASEDDEDGDEDDDDEGNPGATAEDDATAAAAIERAPAAGRPAAPVDAVTAERQRSAGLFGVAEQAARLGVKFDAAKAITNGTSVAAARKAVLDAAASEGEAAPLVSTNTRRPQGNTAVAPERARAAFKRGLTGKR